VTGNRSVVNSTHAVTDAHAVAAFAVILTPLLRRWRRPYSSSVCHPSFFEFFNDRVSTDVQDTCGVANPTGVHRHLDDLVFDRRRLPWIAIVQQEGTTSTALLSAAVPLLPLAGLAMADNIRALTVGQCRT
jgi:hypothetical protein